jgi:hypothetical protein
MPLTKEDLDRLRTRNWLPQNGEPPPLLFTPRCHPDAATMAAYIGEGVMTVYCAECGATVVDFEVASSEPPPGHLSPWRGPDDPNAPPDPPCPGCGWAMTDHGDPPMCPPIPGQPTEGGSRR